MLHSSLRMTERYDQWKRIRRGEVRTWCWVPAPLVFAPLKNLGLIVMDEEQEGSYQSENAPRYHAREVAKYLCVREQGGAGAGFRHAVRWRPLGRRSREAITRRCCGGATTDSALPEVLVADLRQEISNGNPGLIGSRRCGRSWRKIWRRGEQSILFLNRRGSSRMLLCGECGHVPECPRCSVALTYHSANGRLMCHYCGHSEPAGGHLPRLRRHHEACGHRHPEGGGGAARAVPGVRRCCGWMPTPPPGRP